MTVAFIGLGKMGAGMARNLLRAGFRLTVHNRSKEKAEPLAKEGARVAASPAEAARDCDAVLTMLADDAALEQVTLGGEAIAASLRPGAVHVSCSTISTAMARRMAAEHASRGQRFVSAPVFGRPEAAEARKLVVVAAGPAETIAECRPLFDAVGRQTFIAGAEPWQANALKLCGNFIIMALLEAYGEAFATLRKAGVEPHVFLDAMNTLMGSPIHANYGRMIADRQFEPAGFTLALGLKDSRLVGETALECGSPMPLASLVRDHFLSALAHGQAEQDWSSISLVAARNAGLET